ncbi:MAG TPA: hypothetical protein VIM30_02205 [Candidatus Limnocylindrales bacterium]|jgi:hypothetical protein
MVSRFGNGWAFPDRFGGASGDPPPKRADLDRLFEAEWKTGEFEEKTSEQNYRRRVATLLDNFWDGEPGLVGQAEHEQMPFELILEMPAGQPVISTP